MFELDQDNRSCNEIQDAFVIALSFCGFNAIKDAVLRPCPRGALSGSRDVFHREASANGGNNETERTRTPR
jgi:hypothetical protein